MGCCGRRLLPLCFLLLSCWRRFQPIFNLQNFIVKDNMFAYKHCSASQRMDHTLRCCPFPKLRRTTSYFAQLTFKLPRILKTESSFLEVVFHISLWYSLNCFLFFTNMIQYHSCSLERRKIPDEVIPQVCHI